MAQAAQDQKTVLLIAPQRLSKDNLLFSALHIIKSATSIEYKDEEPGPSVIRNYFGDYPREVKSAIGTFSQAGIASIIAEIKKKFAIQKAGLGFEKYFKNAMMNRLHETVSAMRPFAETLKLYHRVLVEKGRYKTGPCFFSNSKPRLRFEIVAENGLLELKTIVVINDISYAYSDFLQHEFLLQRNNEYFLLGYKDYQTLEWIKEINPQQYNQQPQQLAEQVLTRLEADYMVNRNNLFDKKAIEVIPVSRVMLSEISGSFLMLTPQWLYDGILVDGPWQPDFSLTHKGEQYIVQRNKEEENAFVQLLESLHKNFGNQRNGYYYLPFAEAQKGQWFLKVYHQLLEKNVEVTGMDMLQHFRYSSHKVTAVAAIGKQDEQVLLLKLDVFFGKQKVPLHELQKILRSAQRTILLDDGSIGVLDDEWQQQYGSIIRHGKIMAGGIIEVPPLAGLCRTKYR